MDGTLQALEAGIMESRVLQEQRHQERVQSIARNSHIPPEVVSSRDQRRTYRQIIRDTLQAIREGDEDAEMDLRAELKNQYRLSDDQIGSALFKAYSAEKISRKAASSAGVDLARVDQLSYLMDGWILRGDVVLTYGAYGTGKTTLALAKAHAHITGRNLLDRDAPCPPGKALFIATDSGAAPLKKAAEDLGLDFSADPLLMEGHNDQRLWVWAYAPEQGHDKWVCSIQDIIRLERFILEHGITYVVIDSAKSVSSAAGWSYTSNESVKALLLYLREGLLQPTGACIEFLSHDGTAAGAHAGAKAWAEEPSMVCELTQSKDPSGRVLGTQAKFRKDRAAHVDPCRSLTFALEDGQLVLAPTDEVVSTCEEAILTILWEAHCNGQQNVSTQGLKDEALRRFQRSWKTVENTLPKLTGTGKGKGPSKVLRVGKGRYALTPAEIQRKRVQSEPGGIARTHVKGPYESGGDCTKPIATTTKTTPPIEPPTGGTGGNGSADQPPTGGLIGGCQIPLVDSDLGPLPPVGQGCLAHAPEASLLSSFLPGDDDPHWPARSIAS